MGRIRSRFNRRPAFSVLEWLVGHGVSSRGPMPGSVEGLLATSPPPDVAQLSPRF